MRIVKTALLATVALLVFAVPAQAQDYPGEGSLTCSPPQAHVGEQITLVGTGFLPGSEVTFTINDAVVGTAIADADGSATLTVAIPAGIPLGPVPCGASGTDPSGGALVLSSTLTIVESAAAPSAGAGAAPAAASAGTLPVTGSNSVSLFQVAIALVAVGGLLLLAARKRTTVS